MRWGRVDGPSSWKQMQTLGSPGAGAALGLEAGTQLFLGKPQADGFPPRQRGPNLSEPHLEPLFLISPLHGDILFCFHNSATSDSKPFQLGSRLPQAAFIKIFLSIFHVYYCHL